MDFMTGLLIVMGIATVAVISPGPDFLIVLRNALAHGRMQGISTAFGIALAIYFHIAYCIIGLALIISQSLLLFTAIKWAGAAYLLWLGYNALRSDGWEMRARDLDTDCNQSRGLWRCFSDGLITNILNPKATLFFLAVFTQVIAPDTPALWKLAYGSAIAGMALSWFVFVSLALTHRHIRQTLSKASVWIDRVTGVMFVALGLKIFLTRQ